MLDQDDSQVVQADVAQSDDGLWCVEALVSLSEDGGGRVWEHRV